MDGNVARTNICYGCSAQGKWFLDPDSFEVQVFILFLHVTILSCQVSNVNFLLKFICFLFVARNMYKGTRERN